MGNQINQAVSLETTALPPILTVPAWRQYPWLRHGFSTRFGGLSKIYPGASGTGDLNLGFTRDDDPALVAANRALFLRAVEGDAGSTMIALRQVHGTQIAVVGADFAPSTQTIEADGLATSAPGLMLAVQAADCVPILLADTRRRVVAALHAGWRGTAANIVGVATALLREQFQTDPADLVAAIGPSIGPCCYTVGEEVQATFAARFTHAHQLFTCVDGKLHLDLALSNRLQFASAGVDPDRVAMLAECTACTRHTLDGRPVRRFFSHRAEQGNTGRAMGIIGLAAGSRKAQARTLIATKSTSAKRRQVDGLEAFIRRAKKIEIIFLLTTASTPL